MPSVAPHEYVASASRTVLLTGARGFLGRAVDAELARAGYRRILASRSAAAAEPCAGAAEALQIDLESDAPPRSVLERVDAVVHLAGRIDGSPDALHRANVAVTRRLSTACAEAGVGQFIHVSSASVYGDRSVDAPFHEDDACVPDGPYGQTKLLAEQAAHAALQRSPTRLVVLRPAGLFGAERIATRREFEYVSEHRVIWHGPPRVVIHPTYVRDAAGAILACLERPQLTGTFNLAGEKAMEYSRWLECIAKTLDHRLFQVVVEGRWLASTATRFASALERVHLAAPARLARATQTLRTRSLQIGRLAAETGFRPASTMTALAETAAEIRAMAARKTGA